MLTIDLPTPSAIAERLPVSASSAAFIQTARTHCRNIVSGKDPRKVLIIGPCSIHERSSALEYAKRFKDLARNVENTCYLVMRAYVEKPRTAFGWKGLLYDPHLDGSHDIKTGLLWTRELLLELASMHIPCATEFVDPLAALYFEDLISWGFIGARTSASQPHRQFASRLDFPTGFKNGTDGNLDDAMFGALVAAQQQSTLHIDPSGKLCALQTHGNPFSHIVLRGAHTEVNYDTDSVQSALSKLEQMGMPQRIMVDCSHGNCQKNYKRQQDVFESVLDQIERGNDAIFGMMLESHLNSGSQVLHENPSQLKYAMSITDPCLDWETTEKLVYSADLSLSSKSACVYQSL